MAQLIYLFINAGIFLDVSVGGGNVGFRLIVIVVTDEVIDGIAWKKLLELTGQLCSKRLVVRNNQCRTVKLGYHLCNGKGLACTRCSQQRLVSLTLPDAVQ
ncbi:hypothetical protein D3C75_591490 [compost metagenome]